MTTPDLATDRLTTRDLAAYLHISRYKARRLVGEAGGIPAWFDGHQWTASRHDVDAWLAARTSDDGRVKRNLKRRKGIAKQPA